MKAPKCRSCGEMHWGSAPCSAAFVADTPTVARVRLRDAVAKVPAKKAPKAVTKKIDAASNNVKADNVNDMAAYMRGWRKKRTGQVHVMAELLAALKEISRHYANQDMNHVDYRVMCKQLADEAIAKAEGGK